MFGTINTSFISHSLTSSFTSMPEILTNNWIVGLLLFCFFFQKIEMMCGLMLFIGFHVSYLQQNISYIVCSELHLKHQHVFS